MADKIVFITGAGLQSVVFPADFNPAHNTVQVIGAGGSSGFGQSGVHNAEPGGGAAYALKNNVPISPSGTVAVFVGVGGAAPTTINTNGAAGTDSWVSTDNVATAIGDIGVVVVAKGGNGGGFSGANTGVGGSAASGVGDLKSSGGNGATSRGGGGGAAGPAGNGANGAGDSNSNAAGGGGGGGGGGTTGLGNSGNTGGAGGNNYLGVGSGSGGNIGANGSTGTAGGGGGGGGTGAAVHAGDGGGGGEWTSTLGATAGSGGGGGEATGSSAPALAVSGNGGLYGGGGGSMAGGSAGCVMGNGAAGIIVLRYGVNGSPLNSISTGSKGSSRAWFGNFVNYTKITASASGVLLSITMHVTATAVAKIQVGIYADASGQPGTLLASTQVCILPGTGEFLFNIFDGPTIVSGVSYWVAINSDGTGGAFMDNAVAVTNMRESRSSFALPTVATPTAGSGHLWYKLSLNQPPPVLPFMRRDDPRLLALMQHYVTEQDDEHRNLLCTAVRKIKGTAPLAYFTTPVPPANRPQQPQNREPEEVDHNLNLIARRVMPPVTQPAPANAPNLYPLRRVTDATSDDEAQPNLNLITRRVTSPDAYYSVSQPVGTIALQARRNLVIYQDEEDNTQHHALLLRRVGVVSAPAVSAGVVFAPVIFMA